MRQHPSQLPSLVLSFLHFSSLFLNVVSAPVTIRCAGRRVIRSLVSQSPPGLRLGNMDQFVHLGQAKGTKDNGEAKNYYNK